MNHSRLSKILGKSIPETEKILECLNSDTYNLFFMDVYKEYFNIFKQEDDFINFLATIIGSKKVLKIINNYDNKEFARNLIDKIKANNKLTAKYMLRNTTGTIIKYLKPVELQMIINGSKRTENKINKILSDPKPYESIDKDVTVKKLNDIKEFEYHIIEKKEDIDKRDISKLSFDDLTLQEQYDYLFLENFNENVFRKCVGSDFSSIERVTITKDHYMRFDKLNLTEKDIIGLRTYLMSIDSVIIGDVEKSIKIGYK